MLAPGEYMINPASEKPAPATPAELAGQPTQPAVPAVEAEEPEPQSFLLILLRALGAIHT